MMTEPMRLVIGFILGNIIGVLVGAAINARRWNVSYQEALEIIVDWYLGKFF